MSKKMPADDIFIRQALRLATEASDMNVVLTRLARLFRKYAPADRVEFFLQTSNPASLQVLEEVILGDALPHRRTIFMTRDFMQNLSNGLAEVFDPKLRTSSVFVMNDMGKYPFIMNYFGMRKAPDISYLYLFLDNPELPGQHRYVSIQAAGKNRYSREHMRLGALLAAPLSDALRRLESRPRTIEPAPVQQDARQTASRNQTVKEVISGFNKGLAPVLDLVRRVAPRDTAVLILGETGVGKELVANAVQLLSARQGAPFIKVNCGAIPESLLESELFGYERGAFTGAYADHQGLFAQADGGTIFLDEIGELPLSAQVRLLRVLQFGEIARVGGKAEKVDIRVIAATHCNLRRMVKLGTFRQDLWFRLNVFPIRVPPVRERPGDLEELCMHILAKKCKELRIDVVPALDTDTLKRMGAYPWPGNVRELENVLERALIINPRRPRPEWGPQDSPEGMDYEDTLSAPPVGAPLLFSLDEAMRRHIEQVLNHTRGKIDGTGGAAEILCINPGTLRSRMAKLGMKSKSVPFEAAGAVP